ncbi:hypothetical protein HYU19_05305 [Candidatus Woesearchaeota archaeon]|nr:hypothetical protein [Candidatus Woesearchaeota archaeon]
MVQKIKARIITARVTRKNPDKGRRLPGTEGKLQPLSLDTSWRELRYSTHHDLRPKDMVECMVGDDGSCKILRILPR